MSRKLAWIRRSLALPLVAGAVFTAPAASQVTAPQSIESPSVSRVAGVETGTIPLGAAVVSAWAALPEPGFEPSLWLLLRAPKPSGGGRSLARLTFGAGARLETIAPDLPRWMETLAAIDVGYGPELVAGGEGRLAALGVRVGPPAGEGAIGSEPAPRALLEQPGFELASISTGRIESGVLARITVADPGRIRIWESDGAGALRETAPVRIPFSVTRSSNGLRRSNPDLLAPLAPLEPRANGARSALFVGPEAIGHLRLRGEWIDLEAPGAPRAELWAALPGPEKVSQAWPVRVGSSSILIVRTQAADAMNLFERQRLRVLPLAEDRTRAGTLPTLAVELDSKRWHDTAVSLADVDGDGNEDLLVVFPEGLSGSDLVAQWWRGSGGGRFESTVRRSDVEKGGESWQLVPAAGAGSPAAILFVRDRFVELRPFAVAGKKALATEPSLTLAHRPASDRKQRKTTVTVGTGKDAVEVENVDPDLELLGAVDLDGRPGQEILALQPDGHGQDRLLFARRVPNP